VSRTLSHATGIAVTNPIAPFTGLLRVSGKNRMHRVAMIQNIALKTSSAPICILLSIDLSFVEM
jgi:hypothetical protein